MSSRITWIASLVALFLSLGAVFGMLTMRWGSIIEQFAPDETEEHFDPVTTIYWDRYFTHLYELQQEMQVERSALEERKAQLDEREEQLDQRAIDLNQRSEKLEIARADIREWFVTYGASEQANYQRIAKTYAAMEPGKVVPILLATPSEEVAKVLLEMKPESVAPIWTALIDASAQTEANAGRVSRLIELMGRVHNDIGEPPATPAEANPAAPAESNPTASAETTDENRFSEAEIANFQRVAKTYDAMDPTKVAPILLATPPRNAAGVLLQMRPERVATIWSAIIDASRKGEGATEKVVAMAEVMRRNRNGV